MSREMNGRSYAVAVLIVLLLLFLPLLVRSEYYKYLMDLILIYAILVLGLDMAAGQTGMVSLGQGAFFGIGAYVSAILTTRYEVSFWLSALLAIVISMICGSLIGLTAPRLREDYLVMTTLAFATVVSLLMVNWVDMTNGPMGIVGVPPPPALRIASWQIEFANYTAYYYLLVVVNLMIVFLTRRVTLSRFGRACRAIREDELAAETLGIKLRSYKVRVFALSAAYSGLAGVLFVHFIHLASPESFGFATSIMVLTMNMVGGLGSIVGSYLGAATLTIISESLRAVPAYRMVLYGLLLAIVMLFFPHGIAGGLRLACKRRRRAVPARAGSGRVSA